MTDFEDKLKETKDLVESMMDRLMPGDSEAPASLHTAMRYSALGGGKRLRAVLCAWTHSIFGDPYPREALKAGCALEFLHAYTLIHDDLPCMDDDDMRRGKPSCHVEFDEATALLAGDALQALAFETLASAEGVPDSRIARSVKLLASTAGSRELVGGQQADLEGEGAAHTEEMVRFIHGRKTAALISASAAIGAILAGVDGKELATVKTAAGDAGLAFQIVDDLLDLEGDEEVVGKGLHKDEARGKATWPSVFGAEESRGLASRLIGSSIEAVRRLGDDGRLEYIFRLINERVS